MKQPQSSTENIAGYAACCSSFKALYISLQEQTNMKETLRSILHSYMDRQEEAIITTRLDNDDAVNIYMVEAVQKLFTPKDCFINFLFGYQYDRCTC